MPLPLLLGGVALVAGLFGTKKGLDAHSDSKETKDLNQKATKKFDRAKKNLEQAKDSCSKALESLGQLKCEVWHRQFGRLVSLFEQLRNIEFVDSYKVDRLGAKAFSEDELAQMVEMSNLAGEVITGGVKAAGAGALVGVASYGAVRMLGSASTGTAIASLGGAAATNATLAWFGGGAVSAGGLGVAGGTAVLGGLVAGPVLAVGGMALAAKARKNLAEARSNFAKAQKAASEMKAATTVVNGIRRVAEQFQDVIMGLDERFTRILDGLDALITKRRRRRVCINFAKLSEAEQRAVHFAYVFAQTLKIVLETPLLTQEGALSQDCPQALKTGRLLISQGDADAA